MFHQLLYVLRLIYLFIFLNLTFGHFIKKEKLTWCRLLLLEHKLEYLKYDIGFLFINKNQRKRKK